MEKICEENIMRDYFIELENRLIKNRIHIVEHSKLEYQKSEDGQYNYGDNHDFSIFKFGISEDVKLLYNKYQKFSLFWEVEKSGLHGFIYFVPYERLAAEHEVFDTGGDLHGLLIAESIDELLKNWSKVLFVDIYVIGVRPRR